MENVWNVILFGGLEATWNLQPLHFATRKTAAIFAFLAYYRGKAFPRDVLAEQFWPENDTEAARNSLRVALSHLRKHIEPTGVPHGSVLVTNRTTVCLAADAVVTDISRFQQALAQEARAVDASSRISHLLTAVELYRGPLLQGCYDEWIYAEQSRLTETCAAALGRLTDLLLASGEKERALEFARRAVQVEPLRELHHQRLIEVYAVVGRQEAALQQYRELERLFRQELDVEPARATRELVERIQLERNEAPGPSAPSPPLSPVPEAIERPITGPHWFTAFYGREVELQFLQDALREQQHGENAGLLLTVVGPGGIGKTRLIVEAANRRWISQYPGRIFMAELSDIASYAQFPATLVNALGMVIPEDSNPQEVLIQALTQSPALLILDGVDPLMEGAVSAIQALRAALPNLIFIVTSRQPVGLAGERIITVSPLLVAPLRARIAPDKLMGWPSVQLFVDRARAIRTDFTITAENAPAVAALSSRLDGLPLAIEMAAAWVHLLSPEEILKRLDERFDLLVSQSQAVPQRHRSLRAVMDETCRLLPEDVAKFFACLSIFRGGWTLDAAQSLCGKAPVLEFLGVLQQRSLIIANGTGDSVRFRMLETVREYARSRMPSAVYQDYQRLHARYYVDLAERLGKKANCPNAGPVIAHLESEQENFRSALQRCLGPLDEPLLALRLGAALWRLWYARGLAETGVNDLTTALSRAGADTPAEVRLAALEGAGRLALCLGQFVRACGLFREGLELACVDRNSDSERHTVLASDLAVAAKASGDAATTREAFKTLLSLKTREQDHWGMAYALSGIARASRALREPDAAQARWEEARRLLEQLGEVSDETNGLHSAQEEQVAQSLMRVGYLASEQGDHATAIPLLEDALTSFRRAGNPFGTAIALERLGLAAFRCQDWSRAQTVLEEALALRRGGIGAAAIGFPLRLLSEIARNTSDNYALKQLLYTSTGLEGDPDRVK